MSQTYPHYTEGHVTLKLAIRLLCYKSRAFVTPITVYHQQL